LGIWDKADVSRDESRAVNSGSDPVNMLITEFEYQKMLG
jgi:hypothetical protein